MRLPAHITINITNHKTGQKAKIELCDSPFARQFFCRFNRKNSQKAPTTTLTDVTKRLSKLLRTMIYKPQSYQN